MIIPRYFSIPPLNCNRIMFWSDLKYNIFVAHRTKHHVRNVPYLRTQTSWSVWPPSTSPAPYKQGWRWRSAPMLQIPHNMAIDATAAIFANNKHISNISQQSQWLINTFLFFFFKLTLLFSPFPFLSFSFSFSTSRIIV